MVSPKKKVNLNACRKRRINMHQSIYYVTPYVKIALVAIKNMIFNCKMIIDFMHILSALQYFWSTDKEKILYL